MAHLPRLTVGSAVALLIATIMLIAASTITEQHHGARKETSAPGKAIESPKPESIELKVIVTGGKPPFPIDQATVIVKDQENDSSQQKLTNPKGIAHFKNLESETKYRITITCPGWKNGGEMHKFDKSPVELPFHLTEERETRRDKP